MANKRGGIEIVEGRDGEGKGSDGLDGSILRTRGQVKLIDQGEGGRICRKGGWAWNGGGAGLRGERGGGGGTMAQEISKH